MTRALAGHIAQSRTGMECVGTEVDVDVKVGTARTHREGGQGRARRVGAGPDRGSQDGPVEAQRCRGGASSPARGLSGGGGRRWFRGPVSRAPVPRSCNWARPPVHDRPAGAEALRDDPDLDGRSDLIAPGRRGDGRGVLPRDALPDRCGNPPVRSSCPAQRKVGHCHDASPPTLSAVDCARVLGQQHVPTAEQVAVIEAPLEPLLVVAGAGSGKTETMAARVVWLVANGFVQPEEVLGLTFTRKARRRARGTAGARLGRLRDVGLWVLATVGGAASLGQLPS